MSIARSKYALGQGQPRFERGSTRPATRVQHKAVPKIMRLELSTEAVESWRQRFLEPPHRLQLADRLAIDVRDVHRVEESM